MIEDIHWLGHDTFKILGEKVIYTDPFKIKQKDSADIILITHEHFDHITEDHTHFYAFNQHIDDNHESSSNPYHPDHNTSENKYRCSCLGGLIGIVQSFENHLPLPFISIIHSQSTTYDYRLIPYIFHPPLIR